MEALISSEISICSHRTSTESTSQQNQIKSNQIKSNQIKPSDLGSSAIPSFYRDLLSFFLPCTRASRGIYRPTSEKRRSREKKGTSPLGYFLRIFFLILFACVGRGSSSASLFYRELLSFFLPCTRASEGIIQAALEKCRSREKKENKREKYIFSEISKKIISNATHWGHPPLLCFLTLLSPFFSLVSRLVRGLFRPPWTNVAQGEKMEKRRRGCLFGEYIKRKHQTKRTGVILGFSVFSSSFLFFSPLYIVLSGGISDDIRRTMHKENILEKSKKSNIIRCGLVLDIMLASVLLSSSCSLFSPLYIVLSMGMSSDMRKLMYKG